MSKLAAVLVLLALPAAAAAQAVPTYPGDTIAAQGRPAHPVYAAPGPIAPTLPGDTLLGNRLNPEAAVPRHPIAPTMPGDVITRPPQWVLDTLRADSLRRGLIPSDTAAVRDSSAGPGIRILPDAPGRADSLRAAPAPQPRGTEHRTDPHHPPRDRGVRRS